MKTASTTNAPAHEPGARHDVLVDPGWLEAHLSDPAVRVVEIDVSSLAYEAGHIDGAVLWDVYRDLKDADYRLAGPAAVERLLARSGISPGSTVVFYGYAPAMGFWLMKLYGHLDVRILDCSRDTWRSEGRPWTTSVVGPATTGYLLGEQNEQLRAGHVAVRDAISNPGTTIVDVRTGPEYRGERFWPSGGLEPAPRRSRPLRDPPARRGSLRRTWIVPEPGRSPHAVLLHRPQR